MRFALWVLLLFQIKPPTMRVQGPADRRGELAIVMTRHSAAWSDAGTVPKRRQSRHYLWNLHVIRNDIGGGDFVLLLVHCRPREISHNRHELFSSRNKSISFAT
jgi:hypothetical protein